MYRYKSLKSPTSLIRLLCLKPSANYSAALKGTLIYEDVDDLIGNYAALSYVWGDPTRTGEILLDDQQFGITKSLENALRDMRDPTRELLVWADGICINQEDIGERNAQVSMMGRIYSAATYTIIYLGALTEAAAIALYCFSPATTSIVLNRENQFDDSWDLAIGDILNREWFRRIWVFQELVLSQDPWIQLGRSRVRWGQFCQKVLASERRTHGNRVASDAGKDRRRYNDAVQILKEMDRARSDDSSRSLLQLLQARRGMGAQDPRDIIFAHLGIASLPDDYLKSVYYPTVDYSKSVFEVYVSTALYVLNHTFGNNMHNLPALFEHLGDLGHAERAPYIPSWVPDWRLPLSLHSRSFPQSGRPAHQHTEFYCNGAYPLVVMTPSSALLAVAGYVFDTIKARGPEAPSESLIFSNQRESYRQKLRQIVKFLHPDTAYGDSFDVPRSLKDIKFDFQHRHSQHGDTFGTFLKECQAWLDELGPRQVEKKSDLLQRSSETGA